MIIRFMDIELYTVAARKNVELFVQTSCSLTIHYLDGRTEELNGRFEVWYAKLQER